MKDTEVKRLLYQDSEGFKEGVEIGKKEMIEGLVEEEIKPEFKVGDKITEGKVTLTILTITSNKYIVEDNFGECGTLYFNTQDDWKLMEDEVGLVDNLSSRWVNEFNLPDGYIFKDENGNIINAQKIVLEKKKKEYPKTYEECCKVLGIDALGHNVDGYKWEILAAFQNAIICRDAYWKIAGEEMGLGKPWEPNLLDDNQPKFVLANWDGNIEERDYSTNRNYILTFPTKEMRDAFKKNFDPYIEICKELL